MTKITPNPMVDLSIIETESIIEALELFLTEHDDTIEDQEELNLLCGIAKFKQSLKD